MNIHRDIPTEDNQFSLAMSDNELLCALADYCQKNPVDYPVRQAATWILTDNASFYDCGILQTTRQDRFISYNVRVITEQNYNDAEKLLETLSESLGD